jgi:transposase
MITMGLKQKIIFGYFTESKSGRKLAKALGIHRETVKRYVEEHESLLSERAMTGDIPDTGIIDPPRYRSAGRKRLALTDEVAARIDHYLELNKTRRKQGLHKQQMKRCDIHQALLDEGHQVGYTSVCNYVKEQLSRGQEAFIRQEYVPGQSVEFDWAEVKLKIDGKLRNLMLAVFTSAYSNFRFARLYYRQDMISVLDAHVHYFNEAGGVPGELVYDNMRTAVAKLARRNTDKEPTEDLANLAAYYGFKIRFCNVRRGNEKGHVEKSVEYVRRKAFSRNIELESLAGANDVLSATCKALNAKSVKGKTQSIEEDMNTERAVMKTIVGRPYDTADVRSLRVDKYGCVRVDNNGYSVPDDQIGQRVEVRVYVDRLVVFELKIGKEIARHVRQYTQHQWFIKLDHFFPTLRKKPGALLGSRAWKLADPALRRFHADYFEDRTRLFIDLLSWANEHGFSLEQLQVAAATALNSRPHLPIDPNAIRAIVRANLARTQEAKKVEQARSADTAFSPFTAPAAAPISDVITDHAEDQLLALQNLFSIHQNNPL